MKKNLPSEKMEASNLPSLPQLDLPSNFQLPEFQPAASQAASALPRLDLPSELRLPEVQPRSPSTFALPQTSRTSSPTLSPRSAPYPGLTFGPSMTFDTISGLQMPGHLPPGALFGTLMSSSSLSPRGPAVPPSPRSSPTRSYRGVPPDTPCPIQKMQRSFEGQVVELLIERYPHIFEELDREIMRRQGYVEEISSDF